MIGCLLNMSMGVSMLHLYAFMLQHLLLFLSNLTWIEFSVTSDTVYSGCVFRGSALVLSDLNYNRPSPIDWFFVKVWVNNSTVPITNLNIHLFYQMGWSVLFPDEFIAFQCYKIYYCEISLLWNKKKYNHF